MAFKHIVTGLLLAILISGCCGSIEESKPDVSPQEAKRLENIEKAKKLAQKQRAEKAIELVNKLTESGLIVKFDNDYYDVYVDPSLWATVNIDQKKEVASQLLLYCQVKKEGLMHIKIFDYQSGKQIAKMGSTFGYEAL